MYRVWWLGSGLVFLFFATLDVRKREALMICCTLSKH